MSPALSLSLSPERPAIHKLLKEKKIRLFLEFSRQCKRRFTRRHSCSLDLLCEFYTRDIFCIIERSPSGLRVLPSSYSEILFSFALSFNLAGATARYRPARRDLGAQGRILFLFPRTNHSPGSEGTVCRTIRNQRRI